MLCIQRGNNLYPCEICHGTLRHEYKFLFLWIQVFIPIKGDYRRKHVRPDNTGQLACGQRQYRLPLGIVQAVGNHSQRRNKLLAPFSVSVEYHFHNLYVFFHTVSRRHVLFLTHHIPVQSDTYICSRPVGVDILLHRLAEYHVRNSRFRRIVDLDGIQFLASTAQFVSKMRFASTGSIPNPEVAAASALLLILICASM